MLSTAKKIQKWNYDRYNERKSVGTYDHRCVQDVCFVGALKKNGARPSKTCFYRSRCLEENIFYEENTT